jgi:hypothetical protein
LTFGEDAVAIFCVFTLVFGVVAISAAGFGIADSILAVVLFVMFWAMMLAVFRMASLE